MRTPTFAPLRTAAAVLVAAALAASSAACSGETAGGDDADGASDGEITLEGDNGPVTLDKPAVKVAALEWTYVEDLLALGIEPVAVADAEEYEKWVGAGDRIPDDVLDVGTRQEPDLDLLRTIEIDLIITDADRGRDLVEQLEEIATTVAYDFYSHPDGPYEGMRDVTTQLAEAVGKPEAGQQILDDLDATVDKARQDLADAGLDGAEYAFAQGYSVEGVPELRLFTDSSLAGETLAKAGLANTWEGEPDDFGMTTVGVESLTQLPDDVEFVYVALESDDPFADTLPDNDVWKDLEFVKDDQVHGTDPGTWVFGGPLSCQMIITETVAALTA
ncbi:MAG: ABC transporter substrate-binding protein [Stackebrandtia sp.]